MSGAERGDSGSDTCSKKDRRGSKPGMRAETEDDWYKGRETIGVRDRALPCFPQMRPVIQIDMNSEERGECEKGKFSTEGRDETGMR